MLAGEFCVAAQILQPNQWRHHSRNLNLFYKLHKQLGLILPDTEMSRMDKKDKIHPFPFITHYASNA